MTLATEVADYLRGANMRRARAELVADEFCLSISAFNHRLRACCASFRDLKDRERIRRLESADNLPARRLIGVTGHSEPNSLRNWYKNYTGENWRDRRSPTGENLNGK